MKRPARLRGPKCAVVGTSPYQFRWCCDPAGTSPSPPQCVQRSDSSLRLDPYPLQCLHTLKPCASGSCMMLVQLSSFSIALSSPQEVQFCTAAGVPCTDRQRPARRPMNTPPLAVLVS